MQSASIVVVHLTMLPLSCIYNSMNRRASADPQIADVIAADCLVMRIRLLNRTITGVYDEALRPLGITAGQLNILVAVARRGPVAPGVIADRLNMEKSTLSRNIDRMRSHGWLGAASAGSGRQQALELQPKGRRLLERALPCWESAQKQTKAILGQRGAGSMHRAAEAVWSWLER